MSGDKSAVLNIRLDADLRAAFMAACVARDETAAQVLRRAIRDYLAQNSGADK